MKLIYFFFLFFCFAGPLSAAIQVHQVPPQFTDNRIKTFISDSHYILSAEPALQKNKLLVYLPASYQRTKESSYYLSLAANAGYHVISLAYPGINNMYLSCEHSTDPPCYENFHRELAEGKNYTSLADIDTFESIFFRLKSLLVYLKTNYPQENWTPYLNAQGEIEQSLITWSGHSDGAGHAAVIAKYNAVDRVVLFSGPKDFSLHYYLPPVWMHTGVWKTDASKMYAFAHTSDDYAFQKEIWDSLGLNKFGIPVNVASNPPPYKSSHQLITSAQVSVPDIQGCTIVDSRSPKSQGNYVFEPVWRYLLNIESTTAIYEDKVEVLRIYPNPIHAGQSLNIPEARPDQQFELLDYLGRKIYSVKGRSITLDAHLTPGCYYIKGWARRKLFIAPLLIH